ncbi:IS200/IS605 family transposase [Plebeiibacterium sediminum]|uniref:IS200/IS605 family transposase n=1 Tax=Plebeiibacterium sediminum TaxID=2992112 RepID=A0AAE3MA22_9BACT|nr:IS200/IS605 family transposase [Plebeiobacterium sediminum]MCW3789801.1 IS200/IS605 family transposase [Plebeiobacterium sediminum]
MPQSLVYNYTHIIFSTKNRYPFIDKQISTELFKYLGGTCRELNCNPIIVGGHDDHVHLVVLLSQKIALMKLMETIKSHSSKWIKTKGNKYEKFFWQKGYGAFSINPTQIDVVCKYVKEQSKHHQNKSFKDEYVAFLNKYNVKYDEQYVWD